MFDKPHATEKASFNGNPSFDTPLSEQERNAMRAYLQRSEVRASTLHRIATAFISGAGLLLLVPIFFKDVVDIIIEALLMQTCFVQFETLGATTNFLLTVLLYVFLLYPFALSFIIPLYGFGMLLKDLVHFYYTVYMPNFMDSLLNPTFSLSGIAFSYDESPRAKREIMRFQYANPRFMLPFSAYKRALYFDSIIEDTEGDIIPHSRRMEALREAEALPKGVPEQEVLRFNAALGITRTIDRTLVEEVAVTEMALARNIIYLRRLVIRYVKTLLMFVWTMFVAFMMLPFINDGRFSPFLVLATGYLVWALAVQSILSTPVHWLYRHRESYQSPYERVDKQLVLFENGVRVYCQLAIPSAALSLSLAILAQAL